MRKRATVHRLLKRIHTLCVRVSTDREFRVRDSLDNVICSICRNTEKSEIHRVQKSERDWGNWGD